MPSRTRIETVTFLKPFSIGDIAGEFAAGGYSLKTEEELLEGLTFLAYRRVSTTMELPRRIGASVALEYVNVDPADLDRALKRDQEQVHSAEI